MSSLIISAIRQICEEKNLDLDVVVQTVEAALAAAYRKEYGQSNQNIKVEFNRETGESRVFDVKTVIEVDDHGNVIEARAVGQDMEDVEQSKSAKPAESAGKPPAPPVEIMVPSKEEAAEEAVGAAPETREPNPKTEITLTDAKDIKSDAKVGDEIKVELKVPTSYGRTAAQTAKQVVIQKLREAEREILFNDFKDREHELVKAVVQRREGPMVLIDLGKITAMLPPVEQIPIDRYRPGDSFKVYILSVSRGSRGPEVIVSRAHPDIVKKMFEVEVPEIQNKTVEIKSIAREAGARSKVAVYTEEENIDPIGSCVGQRGSRIQTIISELGGEKIDIIEWSEEPEEFIRHALSPAKVNAVVLDIDTHTASVMVGEDQLSLAIGKAGQNVRLAARLTGWKITIKGEKGETTVAETGGDAGAQQPAGEATESAGEVTAATKTPVEASEPTEPAPAVAEHKKADDTTAAENK